MAGNIQQSLQGEKRNHDKGWVMKMENTWKKKEIIIP